MMPMVRSFAACCACAANGHTAAPATSVMNSRRLIVALRGQSHARHRVTVVRVLKRGEGDANCDQLFWAGNVGFGSHDRGQNRKNSESQMFSGLPPKADMHELTRHVRYAPIPNVELPLADSMWHQTSRLAAMLLRDGRDSDGIRSPSQAPAFCQASSARGRSVSGPASAGRSLSRTARRTRE